MNKGLVIARGGLNLRKSPKTGQVVDTLRRGTQVSPKLNINTRLGRTRPGRIWPGCRRPGIAGRRELPPVARVAPPPPTAPPPSRPPAPPPSSRTSPTPPHPALAPGATPPWSPPRRSSPTAPRARSCPALRSGPRRGRRGLCTGPHGRPGRRGRPSSFFRHAPGGDHPRHRAGQPGRCGRGVCTRYCSTQIFAR